MCPIGCPYRARRANRAGCARSGARTGERPSPTATPPRAHTTPRMHLRNSTPEPLASAPVSRPKKSGAAPRAGKSTGKSVKAGAAAGRPTQRRPGGRPAARPSVPRQRRGGPRQPPAPAVLVLRTSPLARVAGALALAGAVCRVVVPALPLASVHGRDLPASRNGFDWLVLLPLVGAVAVAGLLCLRGKLPRFGLAVLLVAGSAAVGQFLHVLYLFATGRSSLDLPLALGSSSPYQAGGGLVALAISAGLLVAAFVLAGLAWSRSEMEDDGALDRARPRLATAGLIAGVFTGIVLGTAPYRSSVFGLGLPLLQRSGLDRVGGIVTALAVVGWAVIAATLRPRLATVGAYLGLAAVLATDSLGNALLIVRTSWLGVSMGEACELVVAGVFAALAVAAWRYRSVGGRAEPVRGAAG